MIGDLAQRRRFGMRLGLDRMKALCAALGEPQRAFRAIHVAGTNGKGAVCAILDAALRRSGGFRIGRYTSPHLVRLNERFFLDGRPAEDSLLAGPTRRVEAAIAGLGDEVTFFEALTAVAFVLYAEQSAGRVVLECGLGGRLDATNVCASELCVITGIGLDHCDWLGDTLEKIAGEKAGILKAGVPVVLARNEAVVRRVVEARAKEVGAPFHYAPDLADEREVPADFSLLGAFNRENAVTALAALKVLGVKAEGFGDVVWPGRFQRVGKFMIDGAHNPPAAAALARSLRALSGEAKYDLIAGFCGDKDVDEVLRLLAPLVRRAWAVRTCNPRSLSADETASRMRAAGLEAARAGSLAEAIDAAQDPALICGSLFLAGEALVALGAYPWESGDFDAAEMLRV